MTTLQLAHTLARRLECEDLASAPASQRLDVLQAINAALQIVYRLLPALAKATTISLTLRAPETVPFDIPQRFTNFLTAPAFTAAMTGCTVLVGDDATPNEIVSPGALLDEYAGQALTGNATVHHDAIQVEAIIARIIGEPRLYRGTEQVRELVRQQWRPEYTRSREQSPGVPQYYAIMPVGMSSPSTAPYLLRVWPAPSTDYKVRFEAELMPARVTFDQITHTPADLPLHEALCESALIPIALGELAFSPDWSNPATMNATLAAAERAREQIASIPMEVSTTPNEVGTPAGY